MSLKYRDKNGAEVVLAGLTPGGNLETGAVATREGSFAIPALATQTGETIAITFSEPLPDADYEVDIYFSVATTSNFTICNKTASGFVMFIRNNANYGQSNLTGYYKAFKLYEVADAEELYSTVQDIEKAFPADASSSNKLATIRDVTGETRSLDRRIDDLEDYMPSNVSISNKVATQADLANVSIDELGDIEDVDLNDLAEGQTLVWDSTNSKWVNGAGGKTYTAGDGISISNTDEISAKVDDTSITTDSNDALKVADTYKTIFVGTQAQWNALSTADKVKYNEAHITDDVSVITADLVTFDTSKMPSDYPIGTFPILVPLNTIQYHGIYIGINCRGVAVNTGTFMHCIVSGGDNFSSFSIVCVNGTWSINMIGSDWALTSAAFTVIADGVKTYRQLFNELLTKYLATGRTIKSLLTDNCKIVINDTIVLEISEADQQYLRAGAFKGGPNQVMSIGVQINLTGTTTYSTYNIGSSGGTYTDGSTNVPAKDTTFTIVFGK